MAEEVMRDPERALETHAREELGIDPNQLGEPLQAAAGSFAAFAAGAIVPLLPWFVGEGGAAVVASLLLAATAAALVGVLLARSTRRPWLPVAARQVAIAAGAAGVTYVIGSVVGVSV
jgi:vacuolar iron transporter family protein